MNPICTCMCSTSLSLFAPDRKYGFRNYSLGKRNERSREGGSAGGRSATSPKSELGSEARRCSPQLVVRVGLARERSAPAPAVVGRPLSAALSLGGTQPSSPLRAPNPEAGRRGTFPPRPLLTQRAFLWSSPEFCANPKHLLARSQEGQGGLQDAPGIGDGAKPDGSRGLGSAFCRRRGRLWRRHLPAHTRSARCSRAP